MEALIGQIRVFGQMRRPLMKPLEKEEYFP